MKTPRSIGDNEEAIVIGLLDGDNDFKLSKLDGSYNNYFKEHELEKIPQQKSKREIELEAEVKALRAKYEPLKHEVGQFGVFGDEEDDMFILGIFNGYTSENWCIRKETEIVYPLFRPITSITYGDE